MKNWKLEEYVNDWVKSEFSRINQTKFTVESDMSDYLKCAIQEGVKIKRIELEDKGEKEKGKSWKPDFELECFKIPVLIENKLNATKLISETKEGVKSDIKSVKNYAVNGAIHYAQCAIKSKKYHEAIAIGIAGDNKENVEIQVYYVFGSGDNTYKLAADYDSLDFLESEKSFNEFYKNVTLTEEEKHSILINSQALLQKYAKELNKLMHNHNITAPQRVLYVSGMLLAMQDLQDLETKEIIEKGLVPEDLKGIELNEKRDGYTVVSQIKNYLELKKIPITKRNLMLSSFNEISKDSDRDKKTDLEKFVSKLLKEKSSANKQIFTYIYENIFQSIDSMSGHIDIMGEMYSEFLKYALGDGKEIGIVLTPPYVTKMMSQILEVDEDSKVMDLATGSAGFLISSMELMIEKTELLYGKSTSKANDKIKKIKTEQLLGIELNAEMFTLAATNMILRGDGSSNIEKGSSFDKPKKLYNDFKANKLLLNPPFSFKEKGMPFIKFGLEQMELGGKAAIIIQDSAGSGKAIESCKAILKSSQLLASIKMPVDLFQPMAGVQTSVYIFEKTGKKHDVKKQVRFIDFRNDGYKRTARAVYEISSPDKRYTEIVDIYHNGLTAKVSDDLWDLQEQVVMSSISLAGNDWNFDKHKKVDTKPTFEDFKKTINDYVSWEVSNLLKRKKNTEEYDNEKNELKTNFQNISLTDAEERVISKFKNNIVKFEEFEIHNIFDVSPSKAYSMNDREILAEDGSTAYVSNQSQDNGYIGWSHLNPLNPGNVITLSDTWQSERTIYFQPREFIGKSHLQVMKPYDDRFQQFQLFFVISSFRKSIVEMNYDYGTKFNRDKIKATKIQLPTTKAEIDYSLMGDLMRAMYKLALIDIGAYIDLKSKI